MMTVSEIRKRYLDFFKSKGHTIVRSDSLIPHNDPTLLFTGAGMNQFKDYFLGVKKDIKRATSSQKCLRTGDLDNVGKTPYHHSFFEMLGNFSFGDYFKEEAITWAWEFLTQEMKIDPKRLFVSVHKTDDEAFNIWEKKIGIPGKLIARLGDESNFWPANAPKDGPNGPCGPCSEIFFDQGEFYGKPKGFWAEDESGRYAEIWNLVFTQFDRKEGGALEPLKAKNIDTGMGLERLTCVMQNKKNNFETDIFEPILKVLEKTIADQAMRYAIADHARAVTVSISDGVQPANEGRGYVIRKLIRRVVWMARKSGVQNSPLSSLVPTVVQTLEGAYPELKQNMPSVISIVKGEEDRFQEALSRGLDYISKMVEEAKSKKQKMLSGEQVFLLYDTYGFPEELTAQIAEENGLKIDRTKFEALLEEQRRKAKEGSKILDSIFGNVSGADEIPHLPASRFMGYETLQAKAKVLWVKEEKSGSLIVLDDTPFYPEGGGQVGDQGQIKGDKFIFDVKDTQKKNNLIFHYGEFKSGKARVGDNAVAEVNEDLRNATRRNHTATHLLHAALRKLLGDHVRQMGSLVSPDRLRFDFSFVRSLTAEEISKIENWVNQAVLENKAVDPKEEDFESATKSGALAFFGEKYGKSVRTVAIDGRSKELCGGTHCSRTGDIGAFIILSEASVASGTRRIEAATGMNAIQHLRRLDQKIKRVESVLKSNIDEAPDRIEKLSKKIKDLEKQAKDGGQNKVDIASLIASGQKANGVNLICETLPNQELNALRGIVDKIRNEAKSSVIVLFGTNDSKVTLLVGLTQDLASSSWDACAIASKIAPLIEGSAGGRKDMAQGGGRNIAGIEQAVKALPKLLEQGK